MDDRQVVKTSKFLAKHLRHEPEGLGLVLETGGWVRVDQLLAACAARGMRLSRPELDEVVARNDKKRFSFDETGTKIRANQGHSVEVDLQLQPVEPPERLFHGTSERTADLVQAEGLRKMARHHVHLSPDLETARRVGSRRGRPVVFEVASGAMHRDGHVFYRSENGVWLTDEVPASYLTRL